MADVLLRLGKKFTAVRHTDLHRTLQLLTDSCYPSVSNLSVLHSHLLYTSHTLIFLYTIEALTSEIELIGWVDGWVIINMIFILGIFRRLEFKTCLQRLCSTRSVLNFENNPLVNQLQN